MIKSIPYTFDKYCHLIEQVYHCKDVKTNAGKWLDGDYGDGFFKFDLNNQGMLFFTYGLMSDGTAMFPFS